MPTSPSRPRKLNTVSAWHDVADVVVVGLGGAGASAAIEAATAGAGVLVLEAASAGGGTTAMAGGQIYLGGGTPTQKACGIEDTPEAMFNYLMRASGPRPEEAKVRLYVDQSLEHYHWLLQQGMTFKPEFYAKKHTNTPGDQGLIYSGNEESYPYDEIAKPAPRGHKGQAQGEGGGALLMDKLTASMERLGVRTQCDARALTTIVDDDGRVVGVVARIDGEERCVGARRGVILCAGGFIMNRAMVERYAPRLALGNTPNGNPNDNGSGIRMGIGAGGAAINMHEGFICLPFYPPAEFVEGIVVNDKGQRFINEDCYHGSMGEAILNHPGRRYYLIVDSRHFEVLEQPPLGNFGVAAVAESIVELETELKLPQGSLQDTLARFNHFAEHGEDPLFHKRPPYLVALDRPPYAAFDLSPNAGGMFVVFTFGGLHTRPGGEVLNADEEVVPGLYAAGRNSCGLPRCGATYSSGMSIGDATFFGRHAGRSAAANAVAANFDPQLTRAD